MNGAIRAFARKGFKETSMDEIASESGVSKGAIYWYYRSKDELIMELMDTFFGSGMPELRAIVESSRPASLQLQDFLDLAVAETKKMMQFRPVLQELYVLALRDNSIKKITRKEFEAYHTILESIIKKGIEGGEFKNVEPHHVANSIISLMEGTALMWSLGIKDIDVNEQLINGTNFIISAIKA